MPVTDEERHAILRHLEAGLRSEDIARKLGVSPGQVSAVKAHMKMGTYTGSESAHVAAEVEDAFEAKFGLERDLQRALRQSIQQLEPGLTILDGGREQIVSSGRIDIVARDKSDACVVIELKAGTADRDAIGQILSYMGDLMEREAQVRGIVVAQDFAASAVSAARSTPNVRLVRYSFQFKFETVGASR